MASTEPISPALKEAPPKVRPTLDAGAYAKEIRDRRGDIQPMETRLGLGATAPDGWEWRWFNDVDDRITRALEDGWRFVTRKSVNMSESIGRGNDDIGDRVTKSTTLGAGPINTVLMEIPIELAEEYRNIRSLSKVRAFEEAVNRQGPVGISGGSHVYTPRGVTNHIGPDAV